MGPRCTHLRVLTGMGVFFGYLTSPSSHGPKRVLPPCQNHGIRLFLPLLPLFPLIPPCSTAPRTLFYCGYAVDILWITWPQRGLTLGLCLVLSYTVYRGESQSTLYILYIKWLTYHYSMLYCIYSQ